MQSDKRVAFGREWLWPAEDHFGWSHPKDGWPAIERLITEHCYGRQSVVVQAGGCCGMYPALLARLFETVYTFELDPINFRYLVRNCHEQMNVFAMNAALGSVGGTVGVDRKWEKNVGNYYVKEGGAIPRVSLDNLKLPVCDALILDAEGYETAIIKGAAYTIHRCKPALIVAETLTEELQAILREAGYGSALKVPGGPACEDHYFVRAV